MSFARVPEDRGQRPDAQTLGVTSLSLLLRLVGKNWDFTAALSDFEQLRQVHAGNLTYSFAEDRTYLPTEKEMARVGRPVLHRQDEVVQGKVVEARRTAPRGCIRLSNATVLLVKQQAATICVQDLCF